MASPGHETNTRSEMLAAIRARLLESSTHDALPVASHASLSALSSASSESAIGLLDQFQARLTAVGGKCSVVSNESEAARIFAAIVAEKSARRIARSNSPRVARLTTSVGEAVEILETPEKHELFNCEVGITEAQWAIAESGTLVLESDRERNRLVSLVPPVHVAILDAKQIRRTMSEILNEVQRSELGLSRAITFITGTSRTSDIELTLAIGVHGPAELHVIIIQGGAE